jgi:hypothetical protein
MRAESRPPGALSVVLKADRMNPVKTRKNLQMSSIKASKQYFLLSRILQLHLLVL